MADLRHLSTVYRRWLLVLVAAALFARALVPAGWMPVAGPHGIAIALCDGDGPMPAMSMSAHAMKPGASMQHAPMQHHHGTPDHPCDFAAAAAAFTLAALPAPALPVVLRHRPLPARVAVAIGQGLAAPPPPPTGPPAFA
ncbi:hypothetical protein [Sphingomonas bacterium]|uniref:hypothetical protein n=1 Tax=Sphingomonas bacterium TaxID=1895847 RepID=UPI0015754A7D|nr:hypothetical protein [Sphingomonas bacterium]